MVTEVPLPKGPAAKLQAACLQGGGSIGEQDGGVTGISGPSKECHRPVPSDKNHSNHSATFPCRRATLLKRKVLAMNRHNISYLTQYVQNVTIPTRGTSHVSSARQPRVAGGRHTEWHDDRRNGEALARGPSSGASVPGAEHMAPLSTSAPPQAD